LGGLTNRRSVLYVGNLVDATIACLPTPSAAGGTFLVSDGEIVSISELIGRAAAAAGRSARLWPAPVTLMRLAGRLTGKSASVDRLLGSLAVDITRIRQTLSWNPLYTLDEGLRQTAHWLETQS
jgi:nucleoside-diphosphate-sugar epimerase